MDESDELRVDEFDDLGRSRIEGLTWSAHATSTEVVFYFAGDPCDYFSIPSEDENDDPRLEPVDIVDRIDELVNESLERGKYERR